MISGATRGSGGSALGSHLADAKDLNEQTSLGESRGLVGDTIQEQISELSDLVSHSRAAQPIYHVHADPPPGADWTASNWQAYWTLFEKEFDLTRAPFSEQRHTKDGREHRHRTYSLVRQDGTTNPMRHDFARREKISRIIEFQTGADFVKGAFNRKVAEFLRVEGRDDVASAIASAGLLDGSKSRAALTPRERAQKERTGVDPQQIGVQVLAAWKQSDDGKSFRRALLESGLRLADGSKVVVIIDQAGGTHPLARLLGKVSRAAGETRIDVAAVSARLADLDLDPLPDGGRGRKRQFEQINSASVSELSTVSYEDTNLSPESSVPTSLENGNSAPGIISVEASELDRSFPEEAASSPNRAPSKALGVSAGDGRGGGHQVVDPDFIEPIDPTKPGDADRFMRQKSAQLAKNARQAGGSSVNQSAQRAVGDAMAAFREAMADFNNIDLNQGVNNGYPKNKAVYSGGSRRNTGWVDGSWGGPEIVGNDGPPWLEPSELRSSVGSEGRPFASGVEATAGAYGGRPGDPDGSNGEVAGADRQEPSPHRGDLGSARADFARRRLQDQRDAKCLAAAVGRQSSKIAEMTDRLAETPERINRENRITRIHRALVQSTERIEKVLKGSPYPDPASRDPNQVADMAREAVKAKLEQSVATAKSTRQAALQARQQVGVLGKLGFPTASRQESKLLEKAADLAEAQLASVSDGFGVELELAGLRGRHLAGYRQSQQAAWEARPEVKEALSRRHGDALVRQAIKSRDTEVEKIAADNLSRARQEVLARERDWQVRRDLALARERQKASLEILPLSEDVSVPSPISKMR